MLFRSLLGQLLPAVTAREKLPEKLALDPATESCRPTGAPKRYPAHRTRRSSLATTCSLNVSPGTNSVSPAGNVTDPDAVGAARSSPFTASQLPRTEAVPPLVGTSHDSTPAALSGGVSYSVPL